MTERTYRSTHAAPFSPSVTPRSARRLSKLFVIPVALTALTGMLFGLQPVATLEMPRNERAHKAKSPASPAARPADRATEMASRQSKYIVQSGDTVSDIASRAGVSTAELLAANGLSWKTLIFAGQQLDLPRSTSGDSVASMSPVINRHRVIAGDTLEQIGRTYGVQPRALMTANGLDRSSRLIVGQRLVIPDANLMSDLPAEFIA